MLQLFPEMQKRSIIVLGIYAVAMVVLMLIAPNPTSAIIFALVAVLGARIIYTSQLNDAVRMHSAMLDQLLNKLDAQGFLANYEQKLGVPVRSANIYLMVRLHISNAYCALGRFDEAIALLKSVEIRKDKPENMLLARFAVASNLCFCAEQKGDAEAAGQYLAGLRACKAELDAFQLKKPEKKRTKVNIDLNEQCYQVLCGEKTDIAALRAQVDSTGAPKLNRVTTALWVACAYINEGNSDQARRILENVVKNGNNLYPAQAAQRLISAMKSAK